MGKENEGKTGGGGKGEEWEVGSVKHAYKVFPSNLYGLQCAIWSRCPISKERSAVEAPPISASARVNPCTQLTHSTCVR